MNATELGIRVFRFEDLLIAAWEDARPTRSMPASSRTPAAASRDAADRLDTMLARKFGGKTARADADDEAVDA